MCRELEDIGLPDPIFNNSTFILKTTVMSASFKEQLMEARRFRGKTRRFRERTRLSIN
jgi:ATP-dependent DNA helicase RecG